MTETRTIEQIWSHYGRDALGGGQSEIEILEKLQKALDGSQLKTARDLVKDAVGMAYSYGYGEADSYLCAGYDLEMDEGQAQAESYKMALSDGDYAQCIDATENALTAQFTFPEDKGVIQIMAQGMRDGYAAGREVREEMELNPAPSQALTP